MYRRYGTGGRDAYRVLVRKSDGNGSFGREYGADLKETRWYGMESIYLA
jgi:hypothetical protein